MTFSQLVDSGRKNNSFNAEMLRIGSLIISHFANWVLPLCCKTIVFSRRKREHMKA